MPRIFISYSRSDAELITELEETLQLIVHPDPVIWYDRELKNSGGRAWWNDILEQIRLCDIFIYALSPSVLESIPCKREHQYACDLEKTILPVLIRPVADIRPFGTRLHEIQICHFDQRTYEQKRALKDSIGKLPPSPPLRIPLPESPSVPLSPVVYLYERIEDMWTDRDSQQEILGQIFDLWSVPNHQEQVITLLHAYLRRDDVLLAQTQTKAKQYLEFFGTQVARSQAEAMKADPIPALFPEPIDPPPPTHITKDKAEGKKFKPFKGRRNKDWDVTLKMFDDITVPDMAFCLVPNGQFQIGFDVEAMDGKRKGVLDGGIQTFAEPFWMSELPVTNAQWRKAVNAGVVDAPTREDGTISHWYDDPYYANAPVVRVSWYEAQKFATWLNCRLPTEREWEYAARGIESLKYPWGNELVRESVVYSLNGDQHPRGYEERYEAGRSWVGALHMSGNVWEWTSSFYEAYPYAIDKKDGAELSSHSRVIRGGSWKVELAGHLRGACRNARAPHFADWDCGFRLVRPYT